MGFQSIKYFFSSPVLNILLLSTVSLTSCNEQQEFYEKAHLEGFGVKDSDNSKDLENSIPENELEIIVENPVPPAPEATPEVIPGPQISCEEKTDEFWQNENQNAKLDLLWVIDDSGSMFDEQENIAKNFESFIQKFTQKNIDFSMGITTTDMDTRAGQMRGSFNQLNLAAFNRNPDQFIRYFQDKIKVGTRGSGNEKGLAAADKFLSRYADDFVRENALLVTIFVSDEEDQSSLDVNDYFNLLSHYKSQAGYFKAYSVIETDPTKTQSYETVGTRYQSLSQISSGLTADINTDFHAILDKISNQIVSLLQSFPLAKKPSGTIISVKVDGIEFQDNWNLDLESNSISFQAGFEPQAGSKIEVNYNVCEQN